MRGAIGSKALYWEPVHEFGGPTRVMRSHLLGMLLAAFLMKP
jgi:hypothetical protein